MTPSAKRRAYLREAAIMLVLAKVAVRLLPASNLFGWADRRCRRIGRFAGDEACWVAWSVETMGRKAWLHSSCLPQALAAQAMLRRRGISSRLCLGVAHNEGILAAHAWVEVGKDVIVGGPDIAGFARLAEFGVGAFPSGASQ